MEADSKNKDTGTQSTVVAKMQSLDHQISAQLEEVENEIKDKYLEILGHESAIVVKRTEVQELMDFKARLAIMHSYLANTPINEITQKADTIRQLPGSQNERVAKPILEGWFDVQRRKIEGLGHRFWDKKSFEGWPSFLKRLIELTGSFLSVYDVLRIIDETDPETKKRIESAINNAFSTGTKNGKFGGVNFNEVGRRFYGTREFFIEDWPSVEHQNLLKLRLALDDLEISDVILNRPTQIIGGKLFDYTEKFVQKNLLEEADDKK
jgi:hypothetical protein